MSCCNLIDDPWITVSRGGAITQVSLRKALTHSHDIDDLALAPPTLAVAVMRQTLLPITIDALGLPSDEHEWAGRWWAGKFDEDLLERYLDEHRHRFGLFDEVAPFAQVASLRTSKGEAKPSSLLVPSLPTGNNVPLFGARAEDDPPAMPWQEAAGWLLHAHCWDTAGIKSGATGDPQVKSGKTTGNQTGPLGQLGIVLPKGPSLFDTLMLNLPIVPADRRPSHEERQDRPQWRRAPQDAAWSLRAAHGLLDLLTWQSRRIRLIPSTDSGTGQTVVREVVVTGGDRLLSIPDYEPHTGWTITKSPKAGQAPRRPRRHRSGRAAWRGLDGLLAIRSDGGDASPVTSPLLQQVSGLQAESALPYDYPLGVETVGVDYGNQSAVVENVVHDRIPLPVTALRADFQVGEAVERLATDTEGLVKAVDGLEGDLCRSMGGEMAAWDRGARASERLVHRLDGVARRVLAGLQREPDRVADAASAWATAARKAALETADELLSDLPPAAIIGREVQVRSRSVTHRASLAELRFRAKLRQVFPDPASTEVGPTNDDSRE